MKTDDFSELYSKSDDSLFIGQLLPDEYIEWSGVGRVQNRCAMVFFAVIWLGFVLFWTAMVYFISRSAVALFGVPFIVIGVGLLIQAFQKHEPDQYALTNMRLLILSKGKTEEIKLEQIVRIDTSSGQKGTGELNIYANFFRDDGSINTAQHRLTGVNDPENIRELILSERDKILQNR